MTCSSPGPARYRPSINPCALKSKKLRFSQPCRKPSRCGWTDPAKICNSLPVMPRVHFIPSANFSWSSLRLDAPLGIPGEAAGGSDVSSSASALLIPGGESGSTLVSRPGASVRLNGRPVPGGLRVLVDRDEIRIDGHRFYFAARDPLAIEAYSGPAISCPRCSGLIQTGSAAVRCRCGAWLHQSEEHPCFTYGDSCPACSGPTRLEDIPWDPSEL